MKSEKRNSTKNGIKNSLKNLKKLIAVLIIIVMSVTAMMPVLAESYSYTVQAQALYNLGIFKGSSVGTYEPDLGGPLDRQQGVVMLLRLLGKEAAAFALSSTDVNSALSIFSDTDKIAEWAKKHAAYSVRYKLVAGLPDGTFAPNKALSGKEYCTMLLRALGYTVDAEGFAGACFQLSALGGITFAEATKFNEKDLIRDDFVGISFGVLQINYNNTTTSMIKSLVTGNVVTEANAIAAGLYNKPLEADARAAVDAYKAGAISTFAEIAVAESKKAAADAAVAKIIVAATKTALQAEIEIRTAAVAAAKASITAGITAAVNTYVAAPIVNLANIADAEALGVTAKAKVALLTDAVLKASLTVMINDKSALIAAQKVQLTGASVTVDTSSLLVAVLTFDKAMDPATIKTDNIKVDGVNVTAANMTLSDDRKILRISYVSPKIQMDTVRITLTNLADSFGVTMAAYDKTLIVKDTADPRVISVTAVSYKVIKIYTSEPLAVNTAGMYVITDYLNAGITIKVGGNVIFAKITPMVAEGYLLVETFNPLPLGTSVITVADARDAAGFKAPDYTGSISIAADTVAPFAASAIYVARDQVRITFSEQISSDGIPYNLPAFTFQEAGGAASSITGAVYTDTAVTLTVSPVMTIASVVGFNITYMNVQDVAGNVVTVAQTLTGKAPDDTVKPVVNNIAVTSANAVQVTFSEPVNAAAGNFTLYNAAGTASLGTATAVTVNTAKTIYTATFAALGNIDRGDYQIQVADVTDVSIRVNSIIAVKIMFTSNDTKAPALIAAVEVSASDGRQTIDLIFSEAINPAHLSALNRYYVGTGAISLPLGGISGVTVTLNINNRVTLSIPYTVAYNVVATPGMADLQGNIITGTGSTLSTPMSILTSYASLAITAADLDVTATGTKTIKVSVDQTAKPGYMFTAAGISAFKFVVVSGLTKYDQDFGVTAASITDGGKSVVLTTSRDLQNDATYINTGTVYPAGTYSVALYITGTALLDQYSQVVAITSANAVTVMDKIAALQLAPVGETTADGVGIITIPFNEDVQTLVAGALETAFTLKSGDTALIPFVDYTAAIIAGDIRITVVKIGGAAVTAGTKTLNVQLTTTAYITDNAGNIVTAAPAANVSVIF